MTPEWLPDWRDPARYPRKGASMQRWAWEFLRRNPQYQADFAKLERRLPGGNGATDADADEWDLLSGELGRKYGVTELCDPAVAAPGGGRVVFSTAYGSGWLANDGLDEHMAHHPYPDRPEIVRYGMLPENAGEVVVKLNLAWPIAPQIERLRARLERTQEKLATEGAITVHNPRNRAERYADYLRALDAEASGAVADEIAAELFPGKSNSYPDRHGYKNATNYLIAAKRIRDGDYQYLLLV